VLCPSGRESAFDVPADSRDEAGVWAGEVGDRAGDVCGRP
jgi:hypothetical protein